MPTATLRCAVPASVNRTRGETWQITRRRKAALERDLGLLLMAAGVPRPIPGNRVHATAVVYHAIHRDRDEGNYRAPLEKALGDVLQMGGPLAWLENDTPAHFTFGAVTFGKRPGPPSVELTLAWGDDVDGATAELEAAA